MFISQISLLHFRNLEQLKLGLHQGINIFYGNNAQGKTNFLESIYLCATGRSQRTRIDSQLVQFGHKEAHLQLFVHKEKKEDRIDVHIRSEEKKGIAINGIPIKKSLELFGTLYVVIFSPEDLQLIKNGPSERRKFLDMELCQISQIYYYHLQQYYKVLRQRNNLLKNIQKSPSLKDTVFVWDKQLVDYGTKIIELREKFIDKLNHLSQEIHRTLTNGKENLILEYKYNVSVQEFEKKLSSHLERDIFLGSTSIGPHKDDILFYINEKEVKVYGSQGQQRTAALCMKLAEINLIQNQTGQNPVLLLDDVLSELDETRQIFLLQHIKNLQTIITCTGIEDSIKNYVKKANLFHVEQGNVKQILSN